MAQATHFSVHDETSLLLLKAADAIERLDAIAQTYVETVHEIEDKRKWIPVTERLPEENTDCLVFIISGEFGQLSWMSMAIFCNGVFRYDDHCGEFDQITHWMPLPQPPEDGET